VDLARPAQLASGGGLQCARRAGGRRVSFGGYKIARQADEDLLNR
jgi:hypothetical protein